MTRIARIARIARILAAAVAGACVVPALAVAAPAVAPPPHVKCGTLTGPTIHVPGHGTTNRFAVAKVGAVTCSTALKIVPQLIRQHARPLADLKSSLGHSFTCTDLAPTGVAWQGVCENDAETVLIFWGPSS